MVGGEVYIMCVESINVSFSKNSCVDLFLMHYSYYLNACTEYVNVLSMMCCSVLTRCLLYGGRVCLSCHMHRWCVASELCDSLQLLATC